MSTTDSQTRNPIGRAGNAAAPPPAPRVQVLFHPDLRRVGDFTFLDPEVPVRLGRREPHFLSPRFGLYRPLADPYVSSHQLTVTFRRGVFVAAFHPEAARSMRCTDPSGAAISPDHLPPGSFIEIEGRILLGLDLRAPFLDAPGGALVGESQALAELWKRVGQVARAVGDVLIEGETGTGKERIARAIHDLGPRKNGPFVAANCAALPENLFESELFGHQQGAFTGASAARKGLFVAAQGGTLFLDEVAELSLPLQARLLRVLQERRVRPVGQEREIEVDLRVVSASHRALPTEVAAGRFREDLMHRVNQLRVEVPPLRHRRSDIPALFVHFLQRFLPDAPTIWREATEVDEPFIPLAFMQALLRARWPGNVRQLENLVREVAAINRDARVFQWPSLPPAGEAADEDLAKQPVKQPGKQPAKKSGKAKPPIDRATLRTAFADHDYHIGDSARALGIGRSTLFRRLDEAGIRRPADMSADEIRAALTEHGGDVEATAQALEVKAQALRLRMAALGIRPC